MNSPVLSPWSQYSTDMKILYKRLRDGAVKVRCENLDDLWYLSQVVGEGDLVRGKSQRRIKDRDDGRSTGGERKTFTLTLRVEKTEFKQDTKVLRIAGAIEAGPEDRVSLGSHHTFNVDTETEVVVIKERWSKTDLDRLDEAVKGTLRPRALVVSMDEGEATVALIREMKPEYYELGRNVGGKYDLKGREGRKREFYSELAQMLSSTADRENASHIILSGPGFEKNNFRRYLQEKDPELSSKTSVVDTGSSGHNGIQEVLKRGEIHRALEEVNAVQDIRYVEGVLAEIGRDSGLAAYGPDDVKKAVDAGAVELLLVTDSLFFKERGEVEALMNTVNRMNGRAHIINGDAEAGERLGSLGGCAAKLRYRLG